MEGNTLLLMPMAFRIRATAALPAAGAWYTSDWHFCKGASFLTLYMEYDAVIAGNAFAFYLDFSPCPPFEGVYGMSGYQMGPVVAGADIQSGVQREVGNYTATGLPAEAFPFGPIELRNTVYKFRVWAHETGNVGNPGSFGCDAQLGVER